MGAALYKHFIRAWPSPRLRVHPLPGPRARPSPPPDWLRLEVRFRLSQLDRHLSHPRCSRLCVGLGCQEAGLSSGALGP